MAGQSGLTGTLVLTVFITCFGSAFLIGYNLGVLNLPAPFIKAFLSETILHEDIKKAENRTGLVTPSFLYAQVSTTFVVAGALGAFSSGWVADIIGRRNGLLVNHIFAISGAILSAFCSLANSAAMLFLGRFLTGINCGITIGLGSMYLTEIAPMNLRGGIGACVQLAITLGIAFSYIMTLTQTLNTKTLWPVAVGLTAIPAIISLIILPLCPESPRFLYVNKKKEEEARKGFKRLNNRDDPETLISELQADVEATKNQPKFVFTQLFTEKNLRMAVAIACVIQIMQQLSGINAVITYSSTMLKTAGIPDEYNQFCVTAIGILNVILTIVALPLLERAGRRTLLLWPSVLLAITLILLPITVVLTTNLENHNTKQILGIISVVLILLYICGFALGLGPVPALIVSEIFRQGPRAAAYSLSQSLQWISNLIVLCSYPSINDAIGGYSFIPFLIVVVICWVFFFFFMPETKNRTFDDIANDLASGKIVIGRNQANSQNSNTNAHFPNSVTNFSNSADRQTKQFSSSSSTGASAATFPSYI